MDEGLTPPDHNLPSSEDAATQKLTPSVMVGLLGAGGGSGSRSSSQRWSPPSVEALQQMLPQYEISAFIACGGMGAVYKGTQRSLKRTVAIKILPPEIEDGEAQYVARFKHEAQAMARLSHPNIVAVFDAGEVSLRETGRGGEEEAVRQGDMEKRSGSTLLYFVMEYVEGTDVAQLIASEGQLDPGRTVQIITAVCEALAFAHEEGIIHRDIKPSNIMIDRKGRVKVADFGLAKALNVEGTMLTSSHIAMGTADFMAPEVLVPGLQVDQRADLYAVGVMLYQMLTGQVPRGRFESPSHIVPKVDKTFDAIVDKAMQTDRDKRYRTATEMKTDVERVAAPARACSGADGPGPSAGHRPAAAATQKSRAGKSARAPLMFAAAAVAIGAGAYLLSKPHSTNSTVSSSASDIEYVPLDQPGPSVSASPRLPSPSPFPFDPKTIKLWDTPAKIAALNKPNIRWENDAIHLTDKAGLPDGTIKQADMLVRAEVRLSPTSVSPQICGRVMRDEKGPTDYYSLALKPGLTSARLTAQRGDVATELGSWPLPRAYPPDAWLPLELRVIGDKITAVADGRVLGTVWDSTIRGAGGLQLYATQDGWFRNVEYVPVKPPVRAPGVPVGVLTLWNAPEKLGGARDAEWKDGMVHLMDNAGLYAGPPSRDAILRASIRMNQDAKGPQLNLRHLGNDSYRLAINPKDNYVVLGTSSREQTTNLKQWPLPRRYREDEWLRLELRVMGNQLTATADGVLLGTLTDDSLTQPGSAGIFATNGWFKEIEYLPLDEGGVTPPPPLAGAGRWRPISFRQDELKGPGAHVMPDGTLKLTHGQDINTVVPCQNMALKARLKRPGGVPMSGLYLRTKGPTHVALHYGATEAWIDTVSVTPPRTPAITLKPGQGVDTPAELVFAVIDQRAFAAVDGVMLPAFTLQSPPYVGGAGIWSMSGEFSAVEFMPLDGLSEAEALKAAGVGDASSSPALQASVSAPSGPPVPKATYPPGQWVRPFRQASDINSDWFKGGAKWEDGWITPGSATNGSITLAAPLGTGHNWGVRARYRWEEHGTAILVLRRGGTSAANNWMTYEFRVNSTSAMFRRVHPRGTGEGAEFIAQGETVDVSFKPGEEVVLEAFVIGDMLYGKANAFTFRTRSDDLLDEGSFEAASSQMAYRDIEFINLDGLSEAQALKAVGLNP